MNHPSISLNINFLEAIQCAYLELSVSGNNRFTISNYNSLLLKLLNVNEADIVKGVNFINQIFSEDRKQLEDICYANDIKEEKISTHFRLNEKGSFRWIKANLLIESSDSFNKKVHMFLTDISIIKEAQIETDKLSAQLGIVANNTDSVVFQFSLDKELNIKFLYISNNLQSMYGLNPKEVYLSSDFLLKRAHPDDVGLIVDTQRKLILEKKDCDIKYRIVVDGNMKWINVRAKMHSINNDIVTVNCIASDITKQQELESKAENQSKLLKTIADNVDGAIYEFYQNSKGEYSIPYMSEGIYQLYNIYPKDVYKDINHTFRVICSDHVDRVINEVQKSYKNNKNFYCEFRVNINGNIKWISSRSKIQKFEDGSAIWRGVLLDITKQKHIEFENEKIATRLIAGTQNIDGMVYQFHRNSEKQYFFSYISDGIKGVFNIAPDQVYENVNKLFQIIHPDDLKDVYDSIDTSFNKNLNWNQKIRILVNGKEKWVHGKSKILKKEDGSAIWNGVILDITKEKELELEKERISDQLKTAADNIDGVLYQFKRDPFGIYSVTYISDGVQSIYNISAKKAYDDVNYLFDSIHKDDIERVAQSIEKSYQENENWDCQYRLLINNKIKWIQARSKIKKFSNDETVWNGLKLDITNQKEIENKLKEQYDFFILLAKESNTIFGVYEMSGNLSYISPNSEKILGYSLDELKSNTEVFIYKEDKSIVENALEEVMSEKTDHKVYIHRYQKKNKSVGLLSVSLLLINTNEGRKISLTARDITQLKKLETDLAETTKKYKLFVEQSELKILSVDLNYTVNHMTGTFPEFKKEDLIGKSLKLFHSKNSWKTIVEPKYQQAINTKKTIVYENSYIKCGKEEFYVEFVTPIIKCDKVKSLLVASKQITQQKKLEKDNQMLLREVHHRVKNNLQIIMSLIDIQLDQISDNGICNVFSELKLRIKAISYVHSKLVITNNVGSLSIKEYSNTMIDQIKALYDSNKTNVKITRKFEHHEINVENAVRFGLLLTEIVSNCFKHAFSENAKDAGIDISLKTVNKNIIFIVKDNGKGFSENILKNSKSNSNSFGLQFIQGLVKSLEGKISVKNSLGAEVCCVFPYNYLFELDMKNSQNEG